MNFTQYQHHLVYLTVNQVNGKVYVGVHSTDTAEDGYIGSGIAFSRAVAKYGKENFHRTILAFHETRDLANQHEADIVDIEFVNRKDTYNSITGGTSRLLSEETKKKLSQAKLGRKATPAQKKSMSNSVQSRLAAGTWVSSMKGRAQSKETRAKIRASLMGHKGVIHSEVTKAKIVARNKLPKNFTGKPAWNKGLKNQYTRGPLSEEAKAEFRSRRASS